MSSAHINTKNIYVLDKPECVTPLEALQELRIQNLELKDEKLAYAGRLDPMASGLLLVLVGDECKKRDEYQKLEKEYIFEFVPGISTDTFDVLGLIQNINADGFSRLTEKDVIDSIKIFQGDYQQSYPPYSSYALNGTPMWKLAREQRLDYDNLPTKTVYLKDLELVDSRRITIKEFVDEIIKKIEQVKGNFRQDEIIKLWKGFGNKYGGEDISIFKIKVNVSSGTYVRAIANDLGKKLGTFGLVYKIRRVRVGEYELRAKN